MKFKEFYKKIEQLYKYLPETEELPSKAWLKNGIRKDKRDAYLAALVKRVLFTANTQSTLNEPQSSTEEVTDNATAEDSKSSINTTLDERGSNYGEFVDFAKLSQELKATFDNTVLAKGRPATFTDAMNEAIEMCFHKLARIGTGNPLYLDSARDLVGYAQLLVNEIEAQEGATDAKVVKLVKKDGKWVEQ